MAKNSKGNSASRSAVIGQHHSDTIHRHLAIVGAAIVFVIALFVFFSSVGSRQDAVSVDRFIFIAQEKCQACIDMQPAAREIAQLLDVPYTSVDYFKEVPYPGYVLVYKDVAYIAGARSDAELWASICEYTQHEPVCRESALQQSAENRTQ